MFDFIANIVHKHGTLFVKDLSYTTLRIGFLTIVYETTWVLDRNVGRLDFEMFGKKWHFSKEYEPFYMQ